MGAWVIKITLLDAMGTDLDVVNAARVSFDKASDWTPNAQGNKLAEKDADLIRYLASGMTRRDKAAVIEGMIAVETPEAAEQLYRRIRQTPTHWSPFSHVMLKFRVDAPLFVARQLWKSHVGASSGDVGYPGWNEISRRYVDSAPELYQPEVWRGRASNKKQGSDSTKVLPGDYNDPIVGEAWDEDHVGEFMTGYYEHLLDAGVAPEQARMVLPQSMMTSWIWTGSVAFFARVCKLRLGKDAQAESGQVAQAISDHAEKVFPVSWKALMEN